MLKGYTDEHVSHTIVRSLRARGMDVEAVTDRGGQRTPDDRLFDEALVEQRAMLTGFLHINSISQTH